MTRTILSTKILEVHRSFKTLKVNVAQKYFLKLSGRGNFFELLNFN